MKTPHVLAGAATAVVAIFSLFAPAFAAAAANTTLNVSSETATYGGTVTLTATLTSGGSPEVGKTVFFNIGGNFVGTGTTNANGIATDSSVDVSNVSVGAHANDISASFFGGAGLNGSSGDGTLTITKKTLTVSGIGANNKPYDGTTAATLNNLNHATLHGIINFDHVTLVTTGATGAFTDPNAGNNKTVDVSGLTLSGSDAGNYQLGTPQATATANITKVSQTFSFSLSTLPAQTLGDPNFNLSPYATAQATTSTSFTSTSTACAISSGVVQLISAGTCSVSASNPGDLNYLPAGPIFQTFTIATTHIWYVDASAASGGNGASPATATTTIQAALNVAANGDTINVAAGIYPGFSIVGKSNITITGTGNPTVVPTTLINTGIGHKYTADMKVSVLVSTSTGITINGITIKDNGLTPGSGGPDALLFWNASSGTFENSTVQGTYTINGVQSGQGIAVDAGSGQTTNLTVNSVAISGFQKNGIDAVDGNSLTGNPGTITVTVTGGSITGAGSTSAIAQNGILYWNQGGGTVTGTVNGTAISDLEYAPTPEATGILAYGSASVPTVSNVSFSDTDLYINSASSGTAIDATTGNTFDGVSASSATGAQLATIENKLDGVMETSGLDPIYILPNTFIATLQNRGIQAGLTAATSGDTVLVTPGTYDGDVIPPASNDVTLEGDGGPVLDLTSGGYGINLDNNALVTDFTFEGFTVNAENAAQPAGTSYAFKAYKADGLTLNNDTFNGGAGNTGGGVDINTTNNVTLNNVTSTGFHKNGFADTSVYAVGDVGGNDITFNDISATNNGWNGIAFYTTNSSGSVGASIDGVEFTGTNTVSGNGTNSGTQGGIFLEGDSDANLALGHTPAYTVTSDGSTLDLSHVAFSSNAPSDIFNYQTAPVNAIGATFDPGAITGDQMTATQRTTEDGKIYDHLDKAVLGLVTYYTQFVTVTIDKFIDGKAASTTAATASFPMASSWNATNIGSGSGTYDLTTTGFNSPNAYEAVTAQMSGGADYATNEVTGGSVVGADCSGNQPFELAGYTSGNSLAAAEGATPSLTSPSLTNLTSNAYIIVWNNYCVPTPTITTPTNGLVVTGANLTEVDWTSVTDAPGGITYTYQASNSPAVNADGSLSSPIYTQPGIATTSIATAGTADGTYYIQVQAKDADGNVSAWSPIVEVIVNSNPSVMTDAASAVTDTNGTLNGMDGGINADNTSFWWGTTPITGTLTSGTNPAATEFPATGWSHDNGLGTASADASFDESFTNLTPGTTYYFVAWVESNGTWYPGQVLSFTTTGTTPNASVTTDAATGIDQSDATLNGQNGGLSADNTSFWWGTTPIGTLTPGTNPGSSEFPATGWSHDNGLGAQGANANFNEALSGLTPGTQYNFVAWVESNGTWYPGNVLNFTTLSNATVTTDVATTITPYDAQLNGTVGAGAASQVSFWISTTPGINTSNPNGIPSGVVSTPVTNNVSANTAFSDQLSIATTGGIPSDLPTIQPNTTYYYVAWANVGGTWYPGAELNFTTGSGPAVGTPGVTTDTATNPSDTDATLNATNGGVAADAESFWVSTSSIDDSNPNSIPTGVYSTPVITDLTELATSSPFSDQLALVTTQGITANGNENMMAITPSTTYYYVAWSHVNGTWYNGGQQTVTTSAAPLQAPVADSDSATTNLGIEVTIPVLGNDSNSPTGITALTQPANGTASIDVDGTDIDYTPNANFSGQDTFTYEATNSVGTSSPATVTVTVKDTSTPVLTLVGANPLYVTVGGTYNELGVTISDPASNNNLDYFISVDGGAAIEEPPTFTSADVDTSAPETHTLTYTATNSGGNTGSTTRSVIVLSPLSIVLTSTSATDTTISDNPIAVTATFSGPVQSFTTGDITVTNGAASGVQLNASSTAATFNVLPAANGTVTVTIPAGDVTDMAGSATTTDTTISFTYAAATQNNSNNNNNNGGGGGGGGGGGSSNGAPSQTFSKFDLNHDGKVNLLDLNILFENWGKTGANIPGDFNGDGVVNLLDLNLFLANWLG